MAFRPTQENLLRIAALWDAGNTVQEIAAQVQCNVKTARRWVQKYEVGEGELYQDQRHFNMRQKCTTPAEDEALVQHMKENPFQPANKIPSILGFNVSGRVAQMRMHEAGLKCRKAAKKPMLTPRHRTQRIDFAMNYLDMTDEEWKKVIWMDEKTFSTDKDGRYRVWRTDNTRYEPNNILPSTSSGHITANFWGWMSADGPGDLIEVGRNFNAEQYVDILDGVMLPSVQRRYPEQDHPRIIIVKDNSPIHTARITRAWYEDHPQLIRLNWPPRSPDLNVIENLWAEMVREWTPNVAHRREDLLQRVHLAWADLRQRPDYCQTIVSSMRRRLLAVLATDGHAINY